MKSEYGSICNVATGATLKILLLLTVSDTEFFEKLDGPNRAT